MDPNANLEELRRLMARLADKGGNARHMDVQRAGELFAALDAWIRSGGFLPDAWKLPHGRGA